jgi:anti-sigma B factor antagonist
MAIEIKQEQLGTLRILGLAGRLDTETAVDVELALQDLLGAGERQFLIDLGGIGYVSSAGLRVLLGLAKQLDGGKGTLRLCGLNASVRQVFDVAGFSKLFTILPDRNAALKSLPPSMTQAMRAAQAPAAKAELTLGQRVATLMNVPSRTPAPHPQAAEIAKAAAELLGVRHTAQQAAIPAAVAAAAPSAKPAAGKPAPVAKPVAAPAAGDKPGFMGKLKGLFGGKK